MSVNDGLVPANAGLCQCPACQSAFTSPQLPVPVFFGIDFGTLSDATCADDARRRAALQGEA